MLPHRFTILDSIREDLSIHHRELAFPSTRIFLIAPIVLQIDGVRREEWTDKVELSLKLFEKFPRGIAPSPSDAIVDDKSYKLLDDSQPTRTVQCMSCIVSPGSTLCPTCDGQGRLNVATEAESSPFCIACGGSGFIRCPVCDGERRAVACTVRYINDRKVSIRQVIVPQVHDSLKSALASAIDPSSAWSKELAFDPEPSLVASAYRGASAVRASDDFHGHFFGAARDAALDARNVLTAGLATQQCRFYAIPTVWLVQETGGIGLLDRHAAYFFDADGSLREVLGHPRA